MKLAISIAVLVACTIFVVLFVAILVVDMAARIDFVRQRFPVLVRWVEYKPWHGFLMLVAVLLLMVNWYELASIEVPVSPPPPIIFPAPDAGAKNSEIEILKTELAELRKQRAVAPLKTIGPSQPAQPSSPPLEVEKLKLIQQDEPSTHTDAPYAKKITVTSTVSLNRLQLAIICSDPLKYGEMGYTGLTEYSSGNHIFKEDPRVFVIDMDARPVISPEAPLVFHLYSDKPIKIEKFERGAR